MIRQTICLPETMTRALASQVVRAAAHFEAQLMVECGTRLVNAKSMLGVLSLAAAEERTAVLIAEGTDEAAAAAMLAGLLEA